MANSLFIQCIFDNNNHLAEDQHRHGGPNQEFRTIYTYTSAALLFVGMYLLRANSSTKVRRSGEVRVATSD